jgi:hypothetical protein
MPLHDLSGERGPRPAAAQVESAVSIAVEVDQGPTTVVEIEQDGTRVVEVSSLTETVVHVVEPVSVDPTTGLSGVLRRSELGVPGGVAQLDGLGHLVPEQAPPDLITVGEAAERIDDAVTVHALDPTPHPAYDDLPDLTLIYENGLV